MITLFKTKIEKVPAIQFLLLYLLIIIYFLNELYERQFHCDGRRMSEIFHPF